MARAEADRPGRMTEVIVDTDVLSFLFKNHPIGQLYDADVAGRAGGISFMTVAELERWALLYRWAPQRIHWLHLFIARFTVVPSAQTFAASGPR